ncbi:arsenical-resistance protein [Colletotrichum higginsianum]|nr:arsenical-resistance protein [Colletotrichum higginsianum]
MPKARPTHCPTNPDVAVITNATVPTEDRDRNDPLGKPKDQSSQDDLEQGLAQAGDGEKQVAEPAMPRQSADDRGSAFKALGWLDRLLALWIFLAMAVGIILGNFVPDIAVGLLVMMYPILCKVRFESLHQVFAHREIWRQIAFSVFINWIVAPFLMVLIWNALAGGDAEYCAILVAINSILQMVLYAPMAIFFISIISGDSAAQEISYSTVATSVAVFLGIPLGAAIITRFLVRRLASPRWFDVVFMRFLSPWSLIGLLYTILILFASQGRQVVQQIVSVARVAAPLIVYFTVIFFLTLWLSRRAGFNYSLSATQSFTAASNNFELAIAVAVASFGPDSQQALASTVGPLIEVPVLIGLVYLVRLVAKRWHFTA